MKLFLATRESCGINEYSSAIIIADTKDQAIEILKNCANHWKYYQNISITEIDTYKARVLFEVFNSE